MYDRKIVFPDGTQVYAKGFGCMADTVAEIVFNTSMAGYQEIMSDPSYKYQAVVMTYPLIGNYGLNPDDFESEFYSAFPGDGKRAGDEPPTLSALIVGEKCDEPSNFRCAGTLEELLKKYGIVGLEDVDTRMLTRMIRDRGSSPVLITDAQTPADEAVARIKESPIPHDAVRKVTATAVKNYTCGKPDAPRIVAVDCGMKQNIVREFLRSGADVTVVPMDTGAEEILKFRPDGVFISNGPGDPTDAAPVIETVRALKGRLPMFGICLGHQIISLAYGAKTYKLKFGHRGGNHPVKNLKTGLVEMTSQNHSYAVDPESLKGTGLEISHINLLDNTVEGVSCERDRLFAVQYHPESAPGPEDGGYLTERFMSVLRAAKE